MSRLLTILAFETGLSFDDLTRLIRTAPRRYKVYEIAKRSGGTRQIAQPAREIKMLQRVVMSRVLSILPIHAAARAYKPGASIRNNAADHAGLGPILKMDLKDFFPSIRADAWERYCHQHKVLEGDDIGSSSHILFRRAHSERLLKLSIGAPSSPMVSNILMYDFDLRITEIAASKGIRYTRYADDMTFSGQRVGMLKDMIKAVEHEISATKSLRLFLNAEKTTFVTAKWRRTVTGVVLTNDGKLSLGRDRKRQISAMVHRASLGRLSSTEMARLVGFLGLTNTIEPEFLNRLKEKYGPETVTRIQKTIQKRGDADITPPPR